MNEGQFPNRRPSLFVRLFKFCAYSAVAFFLFTVAEVVAFKFINPPCTPLMLGRWASAKLAGEPAAIHYAWTPLEHISPNLQRSVIASEDRKFFIHHGFDWNSIETNWDKLENGAAHVKGASTISMQTARNVFLWQGRDWVRKGLEAYYTVPSSFFGGSAEYSRPI